MERRIAVGVVAFGESEIRQCKVARAHRLDVDAETAEQRQSLAEGHLRTLTQLGVVVNILVIFEGSVEEPTGEIGSAITFRSDAGYQSLGGDRRRRAD